MGYTQSGITHLLNSLEKECGLKLVIRDRQGAYATADGERLIPFFQAICNSKYNLDVKLGEIHRIESGKIRIATFASVSAQWLPEMIKRFKFDHPRIQFDLLHGTNRENEEWLINGRVDCAFVRVPANPELFAIKLYQDPLVAVLPDGHELADMPFFPVAALTRYPYIRLFDGTIDEIDEIFTAHGVKPNVEFTVIDDYAIMAMVEKGLGISILPELVIKGTSRKIVAKKLEIPANREFGIAVGNVQQLSKSTKKFISYVEEWISETGSGSERIYV
jgi:DNA-binding transcriptional LysR family regulator